MFAVALALCLAAPPDVGAPHVPDLTGVYKITGRTSGVCVIHRRGEQVYVLQYATHRADPEKGLLISHTVGVGLRHGDLLSVAWPAGSDAGVTVYRVRGGTLTGSWTVGGVPEAEELTRIAGE